MNRDRWLVADLGGTNARFALADPGTRRLTQEITLPTGSASTVVALVAEYLRRVGEESVVAACLACAGPISGDRCSLTNAGIDFSIEDTRKRLSLERLLVVNDFAATARALPELGPGEVIQIGGVEPHVDRGAVAIGPGTGPGGGEPGP